jgi:hypothetical protein
MAGFSSATTQAASAKCLKLTKLNSSFIKKITMAKLRLELVPEAEPAA